MKTEENIAKFSLAKKIKISLINFRKKKFKNLQKPCRASQS